MRPFCQQRYLGVPERWSAATNIERGGGVWCMRAHKTFIHGLIPHTVHLYMLSYTGKRTPEYPSCANELRARSFPISFPLLCLRLKLLLRPVPLHCCPPHTPHPLLACSTGAHTAGIYAMWLLYDGTAILVHIMWLCRRRSLRYVCKDKIR